MAETSQLAPRDAAWREELRKAINAKERGAIPRVKMPELDPAYRVTCNEEVNQGLTMEQAQLEATRCLDCPKPTCMEGCPVSIDIPGFIKNIQRGDITWRHAYSKPRVRSRQCADAYARRKNSANHAASTIK